MRSSNYSRGMHRATLSETIKTVYLRNSPLLYRAMLTIARYLHAIKIADVLAKCATARKKRVERFRRSREN